MTLLLTSRTGARVEIANGARVAIEGEREWFASGDSGELAALAVRVGRGATKVRDDLWLLDFGNTVGLYPLPDGILEVRSGKWSVDDFDAVLEDLFRVAADLPFLAGESSLMPVATNASAANDVLYRAFLYLREALRSDVPRSLATALHAVARDPHRRFERHEVSVPLSMIRDVRFECLPVYLATARRWVTGARGLEGLGIDLNGAVPAELPELRVRDTFDTAENRFARAFIDQAIFVVDATVRAVRKRSCEARVTEDARAMRSRLEVARCTAPLCDAGRMVHVPMASPVLQRRRGYRDVLHHFVRMRHAVSGLPFSTAAFDALLEARDVAHVYELWVFYSVVDAACAILGPPTKASSAKRTALGVEVNDCEVSWGADVAVSFKSSFTRASETSYSLSYYPDVSLRNHGRLHLFDAKFRLGPRKEGSDERSFRDDDLSKMHAYRDAILDARTAWILYPGTRCVFFDVEKGRCDDPAGPDSDGVGAVPLTPGAGGRSDLDRVLRRLLGAPPLSASWREQEGNS